MKSFRSNWRTLVRPNPGAESIYRDIQDGRLVHWVCSDGQTVYVDRSWAEHEVMRRRARYVDTAEVRAWGFA